MNFAESYGVLHFCRFLKGCYNKFGDELNEFQRCCTELIYDLFVFAENYTSEYL